jgi:hypothetical protein
LTKLSRVLLFAVEKKDFVRVAVRFFSGVPHPHLLGVCCPNVFLRQAEILADLAEKSGRNDLTGGCS